MLYFMSDDAADNANNDDGREEVQHWRGKAPYRNVSDCGHEEKEKINHSL